MKYLKIYENFMDSKNAGIAADLEASEIENTQIYNDMDSESKYPYGVEDSQFGKDEILSRWEERFHDKSPTTQDKYEFYADLREEGFDGMLIFDTLDNKMNTNESEEQFDEIKNEEECIPCNDEECCNNCSCTPCECE